MEEFGDYVYIGSNRSLFYSSALQISQQMNVGNKDIIKALVTAIFLGDIPTNSEDFHGSIFRYNTKTNKMEHVYTCEDVTIEDWTGPSETGYRGTVVFDGSLYIGSYGERRSRLLRIDEDFEPGDEPDVAYSIDSYGSIRAMTVHNGALCIGVAGSNGVKLETSSDPAIDNWTTLATDEDFNNLAGGQSMGSGGIWDIISFNDYLYVFLVGNAKTQGGFTVFKGKYTGNDEANDAGWEWEEVVGPNADISAGAGNLKNGSASPFKFSVDGKEYIYRDIL